MLSYTDLKKGVVFVKDGDPYEVIESSFSRMQQRKAVVQAKIRSIATGKLYDITLQPSDQFEEADIERRALQMLYAHRGEYVFINPANKQERFSLSEGALGENKKWLKSNTDITAIFFRNKLLNFTVPIKMDFKVTETPPGVQGDRATAGTKSATLETGAVVQVPPFINAGDIVRINTQSGEYSERVHKGVTV